MALGISNEAVIPDETGEEAAVEQAVVEEVFVEEVATETAAVEEAAEWGKLTEFVLYFFTTGNSIHKLFCLCVELNCFSINWIL